MRPGIQFGRRVQNQVRSCQVLILLCYFNKEICYFRRQLLNNYILVRTQTQSLNYIKFTD